MNKKIKQCIKCNSDDLNDYGKEAECVECGFFTHYCYGCDNVAVFDTAWLGVYSCGNMYCNTKIIRKQSTHLYKSKLFKEYLKS